MSKVIQRWGRLEESKETAQYFPITNKKKKDSGTHVNCHGNDQNIANRGESQIKFKLEIELQVQSGMADSSITL